MPYNLQSLITILQQILNPEQTRWILDHNKPQLKSLHTKATDLQQILKESSLHITESLESQTRDASHKAEDIIESCMVDQMRSTRHGQRFTFCTPDLHEVMQDLDSVKEQVVKLMEDPEKKKTTSSSSPSSAASYSSSKSNVIGRDADLTELKHRLVNTTEKNLEIIPICGMGGIGKTTLAQELYQDPVIVSDHFDKFVAWATISQDFSMRDTLLGLLRCITENELHNSFKDKKNKKLKNILFKKLQEKKYMIILDDMWDVNVWDDLRSYFPNNNNGSRILITTRESSMANRVASRSLQHHVQLLNESDSWKLLQRIVFGQKDCPDKLQEIGESIATDCGGLPLGINVIGGILANVERLHDVWVNIGNDVSAAIAGSDEHAQLSNILSLSYNHLSSHLKPCFLYIGAFPEDYKIRASKLICLWVAEGFVKSKGDKSLEEEAEGYLKALVERNLLMVKEEKSNGKQKRYNIHDRLRELCIKKAGEEKFLQVFNHSSTPKISNQRRVSVHSLALPIESMIESMSLTRSFLSFDNKITSSTFSLSQMVRVLDVNKKEFKLFPEEILQLINLRYLAISCGSGLPDGIAGLCNLQYLIANIGLGTVPFGIWELSELRHLKLSKSIKIEDKHKKEFLQKNLLAISAVVITPSLIKFGFFGSIPNIKDLKIQCDVLPASAVDLTHLNRLEKFKCKAGVASPEYCRFLSTFIFPRTLRELSLVRCNIASPTDLSTLCALPNLETLKIKKCVFESKPETKDEEWKAAEGDEFPSLQSLHLNQLTLVNWDVDETNFPALRRLVLSYCANLKEIPSCIGDISTLQSIKVNGCLKTLVTSTEEIQKVQKSEYDKDIQLRTIS